MEEISTTVSDIAMSIDSMWVLIATCLVMFMQAGFALVEVGFTRSKNAANILMKNLMDFSVGSLAFWALGYSIMFGEDIAGFIGSVTLFYGPETIDGIPEITKLMFQTVFAATAATIVSGAMAERTRFGAYLIYSLVITLVIYPISGHWTWGGGWLSEMGYVKDLGARPMARLIQEQIKKPLAEKLLFGELADRGGQVRITAGDDGLVLTVDASEAEATC